MQNFAFAIVQKFEVLQTNYPNYQNKFVLIIQACPEQGGKDFFKANSIYKMLTTRTSAPQYGFVIQNIYADENIPKFWSRDTKRLDN